MREIYLFGSRNGPQSVSGLAGCEHRAIGGNGESGGGTGPHTGCVGQAVWFAERKQLDGGTAFELFALMTWAAALCREICALVLAHTSLDHSC